MRKLWEKWKAFGHFLGNFLARIVLTIFYFTVFLPFGLGVRLLSDQLGIKTRPTKFWQMRETMADSLASARRQF